MKKIFAMLLVIILFGFFFSGCINPIPGFGDVLVDTFHGNTARGLINTLQGLYGTARVKSVDIESYSLNPSTQSAVIIPAPSQDFDPAAISNLKPYLLGGGKLVLMADNHSSSKNVLNKLINDLNLSEPNINIHFNYGYIPFTGTKNIFYNQFNTYYDYFSEVGVYSMGRGTNLVIDDGYNNTVGVAQAEEMAPEFDSSDKDEALLTHWVFTAQRNVNIFGKVIAFSSLEAFEYQSYGPAKDSLNKALSW